MRAYTIDSVYTMRQEDTVGSLEVGKEVDFIVLDRSIFEIRENNISKTKVLETCLGGERIY